LEFMTMRRLPSLLSVSVAALILSACQPQQPAAPAAAAGEPAPVATLAPPPPPSIPLPSSDTQTAPGVTMEVVPGSVHACAGQDVVAAKIHWSVTNRPGLGAVQLFVSGPDSPKKLFASGSAAGDAETGNWLRAHAVIELVDPNTGESLGKHTMSVLPCD
jgi:hypothetical protein